MKQFLFILLTWLAFSCVNQKQSKIISVYSGDYAWENSIVFFDWKTTHNELPVNVELMEMVDGKKVKTPCRSGYGFLKEADLYILPGRLMEMY
jgi:hypothetical protein